MIGLDNINLLDYLEKRAKTVSGCYLAGVNSLPIKSVLLNGEESLGAMYCDVNNGFALIATKCTREGFIYELFFGKVEVIFDE